MVTDAAADFDELAPFRGLRWVAMAYAVMAGAFLGFHLGCWMLGT